MANCGARFGCVLGHLRKQTPVVLASRPPHFIHSDKAVGLLSFWRTVAPAARRGSVTYFEYAPFALPLAATTFHPF